MIIKSEKGFTIIQVLLVVPFALYFLFCSVTAAEVFVTKSVANRAAREAQRHLSVHHDQAQAKQQAVNVMAGLLPPGVWSAPGGGTPHQAFDPDNPNDSDGRPDVYFVDDGSSNCEAYVRYHIVTLAPGMARLMDPNAPILGNYINLEAVDKGHREYQPK